MTLDEVVAFLKEKRKSQNLRQYNVTAAGGPTASQISGLETGKYPSFLLTKRYANAMGYELEFILVKRPEAPKETHPGKEIEDAVVEEDS